MDNSEKKHIVHIGFAHRKDDIRIFCKECNTLADAGYRVSYITSDMYGDKESYEENGIKVAFYSHKKPTQYIKMKISPDTVRRIFLRRKAKRQWKDNNINQILELKPDVIHVHEYITLPMVKALLKKCRKVKIVYDIHEDNPKMYGAQYKKTKGAFKAKIKEKVIRMKENHIIRKADLVITATDYINCLASKQNRNVVTVKNYPKTDDICCSNFDLKERNSYYCYAGGIAEDRGITTLVKNSDAIKGKFLLAGGMEENYYEELKSRYSGQWKRNVVYKGYLTRQQINELYSLSVVGLCTLQYDPNYVNALPIKLFEYMAAGIPVVCSDFPLWKKIVEEDECGIAVDPCNEKEIVDAINRLLTDRELAKRMGDNGQRAVKEKYCWSHEGDILLEAYRKYV